MSILANQDIRNGVGENKKWAANLGQRDDQPVPVGFAGFNYSPDGLQTQFDVDPSARKGAQGRLIQNDSESNTGYGPGFNRLADNDDDEEAKSVLGGFARMLGGDTAYGRAWGGGGSSKAMRHTFTSGEQMRSLWNAEVGVNGTPVASGGQFAGYQNNHRYGISNWNAAETQVTDTVNRAATAAEQSEAYGSGGSDAVNTLIAEGVNEEFTGKFETTYPVVDITNTGIRAIPGMMGPRSGE